MWQVAVLDAIDTDLESFRTDMYRDFEHQLAKVDAILLEMVERADEFLSDNLTLAQVPSLALGRSNLRDEFEKHVLQHTTRDIDDHIHALIERLISKNDRHSKAVLEYIEQQRHPSDKSQMIGKVAVVFDENRRTVLKRMVDESRSMVEASSIEDQSKALSASVQKVIATLTFVVAVDPVSMEMV